MHSALYSYKKVAILVPRNFYQMEAIKEKCQKKFILGYTFPYKFIFFSIFILHFMSHYLQSTISSRKISNERRTKMRNGIQLDNCYDNGQQTSSLVYIARGCAATVINNDYCSWF